MELRLGVFRARLPNPAAAPLVSTEIGVVSRCDYRLAGLPGSRGSERLIRPFQRESMRYLSSKKLLPIRGVQQPQCPVYMPRLKAPRTDNLQLFSSDRM